jgi:hypothetical protein
MKRAKIYCYHCKRIMWGNCADGVVYCDRCGWPSTRRVMTNAERRCALISQAPGDRPLPNKWR